MIKLLLLSKNEDLKKQIEQHAKEFALVDCDPEVVLLDDEKKVGDFLSLPIVFLTNDTCDADNVIVLKKPFLLKDLFNKLNSAQKIYENNSDYCLKWRDFELFINKKELVNIAFDKVYKLTEKEVDILKYFYKNKDRYVSKKELLECVWGYSQDMSTHTIETHIYRLRQKIEPTSEVIIQTLSGEYKLVV